jgi:AraC family transcriptional regulator
MLRPDIINLNQTQLVGISYKMSYQRNETQKLWETFIPLSKKINHKLSTDFYSLQVFPDNFFKVFNPTLEFEKWALVPVSVIEKNIEPCEPFILPEGLYAVFQHKGMDTSIFERIYGEWIPQSPYQLDNRPHFEILGEKYKKGSTDSEEDIYIPIRPRID